MSDSAALSVLVLAWDEAAPAVRTVIEAAPAVGSLLVLLPPTGPAPPPATPLPAPPPPAEATAPAPTPAAAEPAATAEAATAPAAPAEPMAAEPINLPPSTALAPAPRPATPVATQPATSPPAVRLLHLAASPPPARARASAFRAPAAPYLGATPAALPASPAVPETDFSAASAFAGSSPATPASLIRSPLPATVQAAAAEPLPAVLAEEADPVASPGSLAAATEPASDAPPATAAPPVADAPADEAPALADMAFRADEIVDPDPAQELQAAPAPAAATPADSPALSDLPPAPSYGPFGLRIPAREPAVREVAKPAPPAAEPDEEPLPSEPAPSPPPQYTAPDLNTQVIHYARQAVPTALAAGPFEVVYAPAWPTWLAALELRQRSGRPLVVHLPVLAAGRQPADTAAGWPAEIQRQVLRQADVVLVETYTLARRLRRELGLRNAVVRVVPAGDTGAIARALRRARRV